MARGARVSIGICFAAGLIMKLLLHRARAIASYMARESPDCVLPSLPRAKGGDTPGRSFPHRRIHPSYRSFTTTMNVGAPETRHRLRHLAGQAAHFVGVSRGRLRPSGRCRRECRPRASQRYTTRWSPKPLVTGMAERPSHPWLRDGGAPVVLAAGRLHKPKDFPTLIKAFARLASHRPCRLIILGEGKERKKTRRARSETQS